MTKERLLSLARRYYRVFGTVPLNLYTRLVGEGFIVEELITEWDRAFSTDECQCESCLQAR